MDRFYHRHLPHELPDNVPLFITWNLKGALPADAIAKLKGRRAELERQPPRVGESLRDRRIRESKILFGVADEVLDGATTGPLHLNDPRAAEIVEDSLLFGCVGPTSRIGREIRVSSLAPHVGLERPTYDKRYELYAWCVMANHVHVVLTPIWKLERLLQGIKGFTSYQINQLQNARGRTLWQDESFDHWTRDEDELIRIIQYVENNPVAAGLCACPEDWLWSSARFRTRWPVGQPFHAGALTPLEMRL